MARKFRTKGGFKNLVEGPDQKLLIKRVSYDEKYDKAKVTFADDKGGTQVEQYDFGGKNGETVLSIFFGLAMCALHCGEDVDFEPEELEGHYIVADVIYDAWENEETGRSGHYVHVRYFKECPDDEADEPDEDMDEYL